MPARLAIVTDLNVHVCGRSLGKPVKRRRNALKAGSRSTCS
jgi:hypothetical protein